MLDISMQDIHAWTTSDFMWEEPLRLATKAMPFGFAWMWSDFINFLIYTVFFGCADRKTVCPGRPDVQFFLNVGVASGFVIVAQMVLPGLKEAAGQFKRIEPIYITTFIPSDDHMIQEQSVFDDLIVAFFAIAIGWAWTAVAATECNSLDLSPTCPQSATFVAGVQFFVVTAVYLYICGNLFHLLMEDLR